MDWHPIQGGVVMLLVISFHAMETRISCGWMSHLSLIQTFPLLLSQRSQQLDSFRQFSIATNPLQQLL